MGLEAMFREWVELFGGQGWGRSRRLAVPGFDGRFAREGLIRGREGTYRDGRAGRRHFSTFAMTWSFFDSTVRVSLL